MSSITLPSRWTSQPQGTVEIDLSNPLCAGLRAAVSGVNTYDFVTGKVLNSAQIGSAVTPHGIGHLGTAGLITAARYIELPFEVSGAVSVHAIVSRDTSVNDADSSKVQTLASNKTANQATFWDLNLGNGYGALADDDKPRFSTNAVGIGTIYLDGVALSGNNPATTLLTNGRFYSLSAVAAGGASSSGAGKTWLLGSKGADYFGLAGRVPLICLWDRPLSAGEVRGLSDNPWQLFKPRRRVIYFDVASGGATNLTPSLLTNSQTFYAPTVSAGAVSLTPSLYSNTNTFYAATVSQGGATQVLTPSLFSNVSTFYAPTVATGVVTLTPSLFTNGQTFYSPTVTPGSVTLTPALFSNSQTFYSPAVVVEGGPQTLTPQLVSNTNEFFAATVSTGAVTLTPGLYTDADTFYVASVVLEGGPQTLTPTLYTDADTFFAATVTPGTVTLTPSLYTDADTFFAATVTPGTVTLTPSLYTDADTFFAPTLAQYLAGLTRADTYATLTRADTYATLTRTL